MLHKNPGPSEASLGYTYESRQTSPGRPPCTVHVLKRGEVVSDVVSVRKLEEMHRIVGEMQRHVQAIEGPLKESLQQVDTRLQQVEESVDARLQQQADRMQALMAEVDARLATLEAKGKAGGPSDG